MCLCAARRQRNDKFLTQTGVHLKNICLDLTFCVSFLQIALPDCICLSLSVSSQLQQDFLYFSTLLSVHSKLCFSNTSSHVFSPLCVAAAVLKQVLDAIWPVGKSVLLDGISAPV